MSVRIRNLVGAVVGFSTLLLAVSPAVSREGFAVYEDWHEGIIRSERWQGGEDFGGQEVGREVTSGALELRYRRAGSTASNSGSTGLSQFLVITDSVRVNGIEATFTVTELSMTTCAANNSGAVTSARPARLVMAKFNDGTHSAAGDQTGDYHAGVQARRDGNSTAPDGVLAVQGFVSRCTNASCSTSTTVFAQTLPATVAVGQSFALRLEWDQPNHQFLFGMDDSADVAMPYAASDTAPAHNPFVDIVVTHNTANCTAGAVVIDSTTRVGMVQTNAPKLVNISTRGPVGTGDNVMIAGLIIDGNSPKTVLLRGRGPSLSGAPFLVPGTLSNPLLRLFSGSTVIAQNDNWQDSPNCSGGVVCGTAAQISATALDPCQPNPGQSTAPPDCVLESAILITLPPGAYTAQLLGASGDVGIGLVEAFEMDSNSVTSLHNISTRGIVGTGDQVMIGGFVIEGGTPKTVLVRGRGPALGSPPFSVPGVLADPFLRLFSGSTVIAENDNWQDAPSCSPGITCGAAAQITATGLDPCVPNPGQGAPPPDCSLEAAILITLDPGAYTVQLGGAAGQTGVGLVEIFELPF